MLRGDLRGYGDDVSSALLNSGVQASIAAISPTMTISTAISPPITIDFTTNGSGGQPDPLVNWLRPMVVMHTAGGDLTVAPAGQPPAGSQGQFAVMAGLALAAFAGLFIFIGKRMK
jgi:hypothetical protein